jgi:hypothetical protein
VPTLTGVILARRDGRRFYEKSYDESGGGAPPDCSSTDGLTGIGNPGGLCRTCPQSQFQDGNPPDCQSRLLLLMVRVDDRLPFVLSLPPTSVRAGTQYMTRLVRFGHAKHAVITEIGLEKHNSRGGFTFSRTTFKAIGQLSDGDAATMKRISEAFHDTFQAQPLVIEDEVTDEAF